ncbi:MAG: class I SAM-dependent methyltransferase [Solirubrobacteraceae bacterium MAG38_C4-C5]|nr:class I SAM-dependent methyltransferase [Candidatus Siliceabacter maunaloa]
MRPAPASDPARELEELRGYLHEVGEGFDVALLRGHERALERELERAGDEGLLYRTSRMYLYDLTVFAMSQSKAPYLALLARRIRPPARVLDLGCGIGSDGLALAEAGYDVTFADFANPSTDYLRWRLAHRGLAAPLHDLDAGTLGGGFDVAYAFDVIEHVPDPHAFLDDLEARARRVLVNFLEPVPGETALHHPLPVGDLLHRAASRRLRAYRCLHGRSHLVLYDPRPAAGPVGRAHSRARLLTRR